MKDCHIQYYLFYDFSECSKYSSLHRNHSKCKKNCNDPEISSALPFMKTKIIQKSKSFKSYHLFCIMNFFQKYSLAHILHVPSYNYM